MHEILNCYVFGNLLSITPISFVETRKWEDTFLGYSLERTEKIHSNDE